MSGFLSRRRRLKKAVSFAEALAEGETAPVIFADASDLSGRLIKALNVIAETLDIRFSQIEKEGNLLSGILSTMREGVLVTGPQGRIVLANQALREMFNLSGDPTGKSIIEIFHQEHIHRSCEQLLAAPGRISFEQTLTIAHNKTIQINLASMQKEGKIQGVVGIFIDITKTKKLESQRKDLVANISHELKTPLSSIKGYSETLIGSAAGSPEKMKEFAEIIYRNAERLENLVEDILALSRLEQHEEKLQVQPMELEKSIKEARGHLKHLADLKKIKIRNNVLSKLPLVAADPKKIQKVLNALLENAVKFTAENGVVSVSAQKMEGEIEVCVQDDGPGISEQDLPRIFERFYRVEKSRTREIGGSGLGLAMAKHIVLAHGGNIWVRSCPGKGSSFYFTLPIVT